MEIRVEKIIGVLLGYKWFWVEASGSGAGGRNNFWVVLGGVVWVFRGKRERRETAFRSSSVSQDCTHNCQACGSLPHPSTVRDDDVRAPVSCKFQRGGKNNVEDLLFSSLLLKKKKRKGTHLTFSFFFCVYFFFTELGKKLHSGL